MLPLLLVPFTMAQEVAPPPAVAQPYPLPPSPAAAPPPAGDLPVVFPVRAVNVTSTEIAAADAVFRAAYERSRDAVIYPVEHTRVLAPPGADDSVLAAACRRVSCSRWVTVSMIRLGEEIVVRATSHDSAGNVVDDFDARAVDMDDLYPLFDRLTRSLVAGLPLDRTITRHNVTALETEVENRVALEATRGVKVGWWQGFVSDAGSVAVGAFSIRWERDRTFLELDAGAALPIVDETGDGWGGVFADIGWGAFTQEGNSSLYVSAGIGPRMMYWAGDGPIGLGVYGTLGGITGRTSRARSFVHVRVGVDANGGDGPFPYAGLEAGLGL